MIQALSALVAIIAACVQYATQRQLISAAQAHATAEKLSDALATLRKYADIDRAVNALPTSDVAGQLHKYQRD